MNNLVTHIDHGQINVSDVASPAEGVTLLAELDWAETWAEGLLKKISKLRHELETQKLVDLFDDAGMVEMTLPDGTKVKKGLDVTGSLPKPGDKDTEEVASEKLARRIAALEWLNANGYGPLIKASVTAEWDKGDASKADALIEQLRGDNSVKLKRTDDIHAGTLKAQVRDRIKKGLPTPLDTLGVTVLPAVLLTKKPNRKDT
jgi:hypothetical protein